MLILKFMSLNVLFMGDIPYHRILSIARFDEEKTNKQIEASASSDKSRVIFCSSFRRLQQKAQVFGLETNASVRSRLTHTLEVANTGGLIAKKVASILIKEKKLKEELRVPFIDLTETCCLLHDIGNPPFGHFGESAIQKWFKTNWGPVFKRANQIKKENPINKTLKDSYINDFLFFDGNPQGVRIALHLQELPGKYKGVGLNLSYSQILSCVKYIGSPDEINAKDDRYKKAGYFHSERAKIDQIRSELDWKSRFPITFIMEAADDISYCLSDIEDGIEKNIVDSAFFFRELKHKLRGLDLSTFEINDGLDSFHTQEHFFRFKIVITRNLIDRAVRLFVKNQERIQSGYLVELLKEDPDAKTILDALKHFARRHLFRSREAENIELAGFKVIFGLLECYKPLLELSLVNFNSLVGFRDCKIDKLVGNLDIEWRLYNRLPNKHVEAYKHSVAGINTGDIEWKEWYYRAHLIVDYISGMTDNYALETFRLLNGITI